jgi:hypothetical protein
MSLSCLSQPDKRSPTFLKVGVGRARLPGRHTWRHLAFELEGADDRNIADRTDKTLWLE